MSDTRHAINFAKMVIKKLDPEAIDLARVWQELKKIVIPEGKAWYCPLVEWEGLTDLCLLAGMVGYEDLQYQAMRIVYIKLENGPFPHKGPSERKMRTQKGIDKISGLKRRMLMSIS